MDHVVKPRCRYVCDDGGNVVAWLVHGYGANAYSIQSIDHALKNWFRMMSAKLLKGVATA